MIKDVDLRRVIIFRYYIVVYEYNEVNDGGRN